MKKTIEKIELEKLINDGLSFQQIRKILKVGWYSMNTLLTKYNLKVNSNYTRRRNKIKQDAIDGYKVCPKCGVKKELNNKNYYIKKTGRIHVWCKECNNKITVEKQNRLKQKSVDYKGGKCSVCGYNKCLAALEFHHINPDKKEFEISRYRTYSFNTLAPELDKCVLLCSNCHKELHDKQNQEKMVLGGRLELPINPL